MSEYYVAQERAFAPGVGGEWPDVILLPDNKNARLVKCEPFVANTIDMIWQYRSPTIDSVLTYAKSMEAKLAKKRHYGDKWLSADIDKLVHWLETEVAELKQALADGDVDSVIGEAADVGNMAMMVADRFKVQSEQE